MLELENETNEMVKSGIPISVEFDPLIRIQGMPKRYITIQHPEFKKNTCCGTHVDNTKEIQVLYAMLLISF